MQLVATTFARLAVPVLLLLRGTAADLYLNNPRGSNNKLSEQQNNAQNQNRLFDSQNNAAAGYQIGDDCKPVCQNGNGNYDESKEGAMKGQMTYYQGSELYIEWFQQHGCGVDSPNVMCQLILQYMCEDDNPGLRDGTKRGNQNIAGGRQEPPTEEGAEDPTLGQHEPLQYYLDCKERERNKGLYTADQNMNNDRGATATRQNNNGNANANNRHGLECPEERDYYPYWHPTPWHDIAILTDEPQDRCDYYKQESQNVKPKGYCTVPRFNNKDACETGAPAEDVEPGNWVEAGAHGEPEPECAGGVGSRDNHNGNVRNGMPMYYLWKIPEHVQGTCVLRVRYNITTGDFAKDSKAMEPLLDEDEDHDYFFVDSSLNDPSPGRRRRSIFGKGPPILSQDPVSDWVELGHDYQLQLQVNTNQYGRVFQDRTHTFKVERRPSDVPDGARIVNFNVRGRRGNIVQVYPSVEYDFVPTDLTVEAGDYVHFQWVGSDANNRNNAGNGRQGTDRSNLVQINDREETVPLPLSEHTLFYDAEAGEDAEGKRLVEKMAYLDQHTITQCDSEENNQNAVENCKQLNGASAYFNAGPVKMTQVGEHHVASTRNNDFSNRSQKATIRIVRRAWRWWEVVAALAGGLVFVALSTYLGAAAYAYMRPTSWLFSKRYRPRVLRCLLRETTMQRLEDARRAHKRAEFAKWEAAVGGRHVRPLGEEAGEAVEAAATAKAPAEDKVKSSMVKPWFQRQAGRCCQRCLGLRGLFTEQRVGTLLYLVINLFVFVIGFVTHWGMGFKGSVAYPIAKGAGYTLDLNFALVVLPMLRSLQTALRGVGGRGREWIPIDDPISFHVLIAMMIALGSFVHIGAHIVHMTLVKQAPFMQEDELNHFAYSPEEKVSGTSFLWQMLDISNRCAPITGFILVAIMAAMFITAMPCVRRSRNCLTRMLGGYNLFWRVHSLWYALFVIVLLHAPARLWIWLFFPMIIILIDRLMLMQRSRPYAVLLRARLLPFDVLHLTFEVPVGWTYQAGQYLLIGWQGEWHPFTMTSAPEERVLSVHIRAPDSLDWCSALRRRLIEEAPAAAKLLAIKDGSEGVPERKKAKAGAMVDYTKFVDPRSHLVYCRPKQEDDLEAPTADLGVDPTAPPTSATIRSRTRADTAMPKVEPRKSVDSFDTVLHPEVDLPGDAVMLQISGPFGAPAQRVWEFETVMVVGAGIGVTPFVSILRSAQLRAQQRCSILGASTLSPGQPRSGPGVQPRSPVARSAEEAATIPLGELVHPAGEGGEEHPSALGEEHATHQQPPRRVPPPAQPMADAAPPSAVDHDGWGTSDLQELVQDVIPVPGRIHFYWIVRSQEEFNWFYDLLSAAVSGPARDCIEINVFTTGEVELSQVKTLPCAHHQWFGRPNWGRIFKQNKAQHPHEHIGVFLCGSPLIGEELARQSQKNSDPPEVAGGTRFSFFKETF